MKALFCTDGSEISLYAIEQALKFIKKDFVIDIAAVTETGFLNTFITFPYETEHGFSEYKNKSETALEIAANLIELRKFKTGEKYLLEGHVADEILNLIYTGNYNVIILGSHGKKGFKKRLGSVSYKILQKSSVPVLTVKPSMHFDLSKRKEFLIAVDGSKHSFDAAEKSLEILEFNDISVEIIIVKSTPEEFPVEIRDDKEWLESCLKKQDEIMHEVLEKTSEILRKNNITDAKKTLLAGEPSEKILKHAEENPKDLIITGSHGREGLSSLILGSVSKAVSENTNSPILIIYNKL